MKKKLILYGIRNVNWYKKEDILKIAKKGIDKTLIEIRNIEVKKEFKTKLTCIIRKIYI